MDGARSGEPGRMTQITDERRFTRPPQTTTAVSADAVEHAIRQTTLRCAGLRRQARLASMFVEGAVIVLAGYALSPASSRATRASR